MIAVTFTPECMQLMRDLGISYERPRLTINDRHRGLVSDGIDRLVAIHWFGDDDVILVDSIIKKTQIDRPRSQIQIAEVQAQLVLLLQSNLPTGMLTRKAHMERLLTIVADSFGEMVACHPDNAPAKLYSGPWDGQKIEIKGGNTRGSIYVTGTFYPSENRCELVWALNVEKYRRWLAEAAVSGLVHKGPIPSREALDPFVAMAKAYVKDFPQLYPNVRVTPEAIQMGLALNVLQPALGEKWCRRNLLDPRSHHPLRLKGLGAAAKKAQLQAVQLAEMLFNLQTVHGFRYRTEDLKKRDLASALAEMEAAKLLATSGIPFSFVRPSGRRGLDYDAEIRLPSGRVASCEVKTKSKRIPVSTRTIFNSLKASANQAPDHMPLIVLLKLSDQWITDPQLLSFA